MILTQQTMLRILTSNAATEIEVPIAVAVALSIEIILEDTNNIGADRSVPRTMLVATCRNSMNFIILWTNL